MLFIFETTPEHVLQLKITYESKSCTFPSRLLTGCMHFLDPVLLIPECPTIELGDSVAATIYVDQLVPGKKISGKVYVQVTGSQEVDNNNPLNEKASIFADAADLGAKVEYLCHPLMGEYRASRPTDYKDTASNLKKHLEIAKHVAEYVRTQSVDESLSRNERDYIKKKAKSVRVDENTNLLLKSTPSGEKIMITTPEDLEQVTTLTTMRSCSSGTRGINVSIFSRC